MNNPDKPNSASLPCSQYLNESNPAFAGLIQQLEQITQLQQVFNQIAPTELVKHCRVINIQERSLVIGTEQAHWATRLRYCTPEILDKLKAYPNTPSISSIRVIVCQIPDLTSNHHHPKATISAQLAADLETMAESIDDDDIADCLRRISKHR